MAPHVVLMLFEASSNLLVKHNGVDQGFLHVLTLFVCILTKGKHLLKETTNDIIMSIYIIPWNITNQLNTLNTVNLKDFSIS